MLYIFRTTASAVVSMNLFIIALTTCILWVQAIVPQSYSVELLNLFTGKAKCFSTPTRPLRKHISLRGNASWFIYTFAFPNGRVMVRMPFLTALNLIITTRWWMERQCLLANCQPDHRGRHLVFQIHWNNSLFRKRVCWYDGGPPWLVKKKAVKAGSSICCGGMP